MKITLNFNEEIASFYNKTMTVMQINCDRCTVYRNSNIFPMFQDW